MIFLDFETRSFADINACGGWHYAQHATSEIVCGAALVGDVVHVWTPFNMVSGAFGGYLAPDEHLEKLGFDANRFRCTNLHLNCPTVPKDVIDAALEQGVCAHNADDFDRVVWDELELPEVEWTDSINLVRRRGLPGSLDKCGEQLYGLGKWDQGRKAMLTVAKPHKVGKKEVFVPPNPEILRDIIRYCLLDVFLLAAIWRDENLGEPHPDDPVLAAHRKINRRGMLVDVEAARKIQIAEEKHKDAMVEACPLTLEQLRSTQKLTAWLKAQGILVEDCTKVTIQAELDRTNDEVIRSVLRARLAVAKITAGKAAAARAAVCSDGRLRGVLAYYGAATTGRWAGRLLQPHNLPRPPKNLPVDIHDRPEDAPMVARDLGIEVEKVIGGMLRGLVVAP